MRSKYKGSLSVVGTGPGAAEDMTIRARSALMESDIIVGYDRYIKLIKDDFPEKIFYSTNMRRERERCEYALERAAEGKKTSLISGGDSGIYGMAALVFEILEEKKLAQKYINNNIPRNDQDNNHDNDYDNDYDSIDIKVIPGVTAAVSGGALLGAPLTNDFAVISLSDLLTPWNEIERRLKSLAASGLTTVIYNPGSKKRRDQLKRACDIFLENRSADTVCAVASNISREGEGYELLTLAELRERHAAMDSTVFIGSRSTKLIGNKMITPRGYDKQPRRSVIIFGGTSEGSELAMLAAENGCSVTLSAASDYGTRAASESIESIGKIQSIKRHIEHIENVNNINIVKGDISRLITNEYDCVISAVHPFAADADSEIRRLAEERGVRYIRVLRDTAPENTVSETENMRLYSSMDEIIDVLNTEEYIGKRIFFSTGSRSANSYKRLKNGPERAVIRCLPDERAVRLCMDAGFSGRNLICMQGPFSVSLNIAMFSESGADVLVTKLSGRAGGTDTKLRAARELNMQVMALAADAGKNTGNNADSCYSIEEVKRMLNMM